MRIDLGSIIDLDLIETAYFVKVLRFCNLKPIY
jgi:hypothetical protein